MDEGFGLQARALGDREAVLDVETFGAWLSYRDGKFEEAALSHARIARQTRSSLTAITSTLACASAWMEDFAFERARVMALEGMALAARARQPYLEARAAWIVRSCGYRIGEIFEVDHDLLAAVARLRTPWVESLVMLNEAAVAWRSGAYDEARALASEVQGVSDALGRSERSLIARCIAIASGASVSAEEKASLLARARACAVPGLGMQAIGLLGVDVTSDTALSLARQVPEARWGKRMEVMSVDEALRACAVRVGTRSRGTG